MFISYDIEDFSNKKLKTKIFLIHRLENLDYFPPSSIKSPHKHSFYELFLLESGHAIHNVDFTTYDVKGGYLFLIHQGQVHHWERNISNELRGYRILFTKEFLQSSFIPSNLLFELMYLYQVRYNPLVSISQNSLLYTYASLLLTEYLQEKITLESIEALLFLFLNEIKKNISYTPTNETTYSNLQIRSYQLFLKEVEENYNKNLPLEYYSKNINISTRQLSRMVKNISNTTLNQIILNRRILQSKRLLKYSDLSISEIAYEIGFKEPSYYCKIFKRTTGITPSQFKKQLNV